MSTELKIGDTVRRITDCPDRRSLQKGETGVIDRFGVPPMWATWAHIKGEHEDAFHDPRNLELVAPGTSATLDPHVSEAIRKTLDGTAETVEVDWRAAPLDPSKVKAGDTVTLERDGGRLPGQEVIVVSESGMGYTTVILRGGLQVYITGPDAWTLTAHQPAPEPEPEWKPGTVAEASIDGHELPYERYRGLVGTSTFEYLNDEGVPCFADLSRLRDVRPLVVIDPAAVDVEALIRAVEDSPQVQGWRHVVISLLAELGIEANS